MFHDFARFFKKQHFRKTNLREHRVLDDNTENVETLLCVMNISCLKCCARSNLLHHRKQRHTKKDISMQHFRKYIKENAFHGAPNFRK